MSEIDTRSCVHCTWLGTKMDQLPCKDCHEHSLYDPINKEEKLVDNKEYKKDNINPDHYKSETSLECIETMEIIFGRDPVIDFCVCNAWKYIWRWKNKNGEEDLVKAGWYLSYANDRMASDVWRYNLLRRMIHYISANQGVEVSKDG